MLKKEESNKAETSVMKELTFYVYFIINIYVGALLLPVLQTQTTEIKAQLTLYWPQSTNYQIAVHGNDLFNRFITVEDSEFCGFQIYF